MGLSVRIYENDDLATVNEPMQYYPLFETTCRSRGTGFFYIRNKRG